MSSVEITKGSPEGRLPGENQWRGDAQEGGGSENRFVFRGLNLLGA